MYCRNEEPESGEWLWLLLWAIVAVGLIAVQGCRKEVFAPAVPGAYYGWCTWCPEQPEPDDDPVYVPFPGDTQ